ncbi:MAG: hypothetical protein WC915_04905, partial [archaeon]
VAPDFVPFTYNFTWETESTVMTTWVQVFREKGSEVRVPAPLTCAMNLLLAKYIKRPPVEDEVTVLSKTLDALGMLLT